MNMAYCLSDKEKLFCKLVSFAQDEIDISRNSEGCIIENHSVKVVGRFKKCFGLKEASFIVSFPHTERMQLMKEKMEHNNNYIEQKVDGGWEFGIGCPESMSVEVLTNGEIHLDWSTYEEIFDYILD